MSSPCAGHLSLWRSNPSGLDLGSYSSLLNDNCWIRQETNNYSYNDKRGMCVVPKLRGAKSHQLFAPHPRQKILAHRHWLSNDTARGLVTHPPQEMHRFGSCIRPVNKPVCIPSQNHVIVIVAVPSLELPKFCFVQ